MESPRERSDRIQKHGPEMLETPSGRHRSSWRGQYFPTRLESIEDGDDVGGSSGLEVGGISSSSGGEAGFRD